MLRTRYCRSELLLESLPAVRSFSAVVVSAFHQLESSVTFRFFLFFLLLLLRSHARLFHPQVWVEDATPSLGGSNIHDFVIYGPGALFRPVSGYLTLVPKIISGLSLIISFSYYPLISTIFAWVTILVVLVVVSSAHTQLRGGILLGSLALLVPSDAEVLGLPLYTFWWTTLLLFVVIEWAKASTDLKWRVPIVLLAGLSSPVIVGAAPIFLLRSVIYRKVWQEWAVSIIAVLCAAMQLTAYATCDINFPRAPGITLGRVAHIIPLFLGRYVFGNLIAGKAALWFAGIALLGVATVALFRSFPSFRYGALVSLFAVTIAMIMHRVDISILNPVWAGPRYFFLPFVLISWFVTQILFDDNPRYFKVVGCLIILASVANAVPVLTRNHDDLHWREHALSCPFFDRYSIPVEYDGQASRAWQLRLSGSQCRALLSHDLFYRKDAPPTFPYSLQAVGRGNIKALAGAESIAENEWQSSDVLIPGSNRVAGVSFFKSRPAGTSRLSLRVRKGQSVLYRSADLTTHAAVLIDDGRSQFLQGLRPVPGWALLSFSNGLLPDAFTVTFVGGGAGEWMMIGVKKEQ